MWYQPHGRAQPACYRLKPTASHISIYKIWNKCTFSAKLQIIDGGEGLFYPQHFFPLSPTYSYE
jgi:hypothetical protein